MICFMNSKVTKSLCFHNSKNSPMSGRKKIMKVFYNDFVIANEEKESLKSAC